MRAVDLHLVLSHAAEQVTAALETPLGPILDRASCSEALVSEARRSWRRLTRQGESLLTDSNGRDGIGQQLAAIAFPEPILDRLHEEIRAAVNHGGCVRLSLFATTPELQSLPWELTELLPFEPGSLLGGSLGLHPRLRVVRRANSPEELPQTLDDEVRVLVVYADPATTRFPKLSWLDAEVRSIASAFQASGRSSTHVRFLPDAVPANLARTIREFRPTIMHFAGHGEQRPSGSVIALQGASEGDAIELYASQLAPWLHDAGTKLIFLAACSTHQFATELIELGLPYSIGMQGVLRDAAQVPFARAFYSSLAQGSPVDSAMAEARNALGVAGLDWAIPTLSSSVDSYSLTSSNAEELDHHSWLVPTNLGSRVLPFVGRAKERADVRTAIEREGLRLIAITGIGGIGKSSLARLVGADLSPQYPDGVFAVDFAELEDKESCLLAIANALGLANRAGFQVGAVVSELANRRLLLILDSCEGLAQAQQGGFLRDLVESVQTLTCIATSRTRIGELVDREVLLEPLGLSEDDTAMSESLLLFQQVAHSVGRRGELAPEHARMASQICRALDGLPLAIFLAAGRLRYVSLEDLLKLVTVSGLRASGRGRDNPESLRAVLASSVESLSGAERRALVQASLLHGEFTLRDFAAVGGVDLIEAADLLDQLCASSLLMSRTENGLTHFRGLSTASEFVLSSVPQSDEDQEAAIRRHAQYFLALAIEAGHAMTSGLWAEASNRLQRNLRNVRAALCSALRLGFEDQVCEVSDALALPLYESGLLADFYALAQLGFQGAESREDYTLQAKLGGLLGAYFARIKDIPASTRWWERRAEICGLAGDLVGKVDALIDLSCHVYQRGEFDEADRRLVATLPFAEASDAPELVATIQVLRALIAMRQERLLEAEALAALAERVAATATRLDPLMFVDTNLARVFAYCGQDNRAIRHWLHLFEVALSGDRIFHAAAGLMGVADFQLARGREAEEIRCLVTFVKMTETVPSQRRSEGVSRLNDYALRSRGSALELFTQNLQARSWRDLIEEVILELNSRLDSE